MIWDNARYNHARLVRDYPATTACRVEILFLPSYSPNLNVIERLWGFIKDRVLRNYHTTFAAFCMVITQFFTSLHDYDYDEQLRSLMTENFQIFNSV